MIPPRRPRPPVALACLLLLGASAPARLGVAGHGGAVQLSGVSAGPYAVSAWTQPTPPTTARCTVDVAVMRQETRVPVPLTAVRLIAEPIGRTGAPIAPVTPVTAGTPIGPITVDASRDRDPLRVRHRAELRLPDAGDWRITVAVSGPDGIGQATFTLRVEPASTIPWLPLGLGSGAAALALMWRAERWRRHRRPGPHTLSIGATTVRLMSSAGARFARPYRVSFAWGAPPGATEAGGHGHGAQPGHDHSLPPAKTP